MCPPSDSNGRYFAATSGSVASRVVLRNKRFCLFLLVLFDVCVEVMNVTILGLGWVSAVGIATGYGLDGPGIESRWWRDFPHPSRPALGPTQPIQWVPGLSRW